MKRDYTNVPCAVCKQLPGAAAHVFGAHRAHAYVPPIPDPNDHLGAFQGLGGLRVKIEGRPNMPQFGVFLGLLLDEHGETQAVVRLDHYGLMLTTVHPSKVTPVTSEDEQAYKA